jgi:hypothetical protein
MKMTASLLLLLTVGACASYTPPPVDDPYAKQGWNDVLANEYAEFSKSEAEQEYFDSAKKFAAKSERARKGEHVLPEQASDWDITGESLVTLEQARSRLMALLNHKDARKEPNGSKLARVQLLHDCWVKQRGIKKREANFTCKEEFFHTIKELEQALGITYAPADAARPAPDKE